MKGVSTSKYVEGELKQHFIDHDGFLHDRMQYPPDVESVRLMKIS